MRCVRLVLLLVLASTAGFAADHNVSVGPGTSYSPADLTIAPGDRVIWTLQGGVHNVRADDGSFGNAVSGSWTTFERVFPSAGNFEYFCEAHSTANGSFMNGIVRVSGGGGAPGSLRFSAASATVGEGAGQVTLTVQRTGGDDGAVSVQYFTADGSATFPGGDYEQTNGTLNWADNDDADKTFVVPILNDTAEEGSQSFTVSLQSATGGATIIAPSTVTVTITDNDGGGGPGTIRFTQGTQSVSEGAGTVTVTAERTGGTTGAVGVSYATANGGATSPDDYAAASSTLSWGNGDGANKSFTVNLVNDTADEPNETFTATLSAPTGGATLGSPSSQTVTINDDDAAECVPSTCVTSSSQLCLAGGSGIPGRFRITVRWTNFVAESGDGVALAYTADSGFFYFFQPDVLELLVKIVNGCGFNDAYWFFNAAASNVGLVYTVTDLQTCETRTVTNPVGNFASNGDIAFFASSCP